MPKKKVDPQKILDVARLWNLHKGEQGNVSFICKSLKVHGVIVGKAKQMVLDGDIKFDDAGEPSFTRPVEKILGDIARTKEDESKILAKKEVVKRHLEGISGEAVSLHDQYLTVGRAISQAFFQWAAKHGLTPQQMREMQIHRVILKALNTADQHDGLVQRIQDLEQELTVYRKEIDPIMRLKEGLVLVNQFLRFAEYAEILGFDLEASGMINYYEKLFNGYLKGEMN